MSFTLTSLPWHGLQNETYCECGGTTEQGLHNLLHDEQEQAEFEELVKLHREYLNNLGMKEEDILVPQDSVPVTELGR